MRWHFQVRVSAAERGASRVLQVLETQQVVPERFHAERCHTAMHIRFVLEAQEQTCYRIGHLLRRAPWTACVHWVALEDESEEFDAWHRTAFASWSARESGMELDPDSAWWHDAPSTLLLHDNDGVRQPAHETEVRMRWTAAHLYMLFLCDYVHLALRPGVAQRERATPKLWEHDVAELFLGKDADLFQRYMEFEVSPRGEWIDLDIAAESGTVLASADLHSGFLVAASIQRDARRWTACMRVPLASFGDLRDKTLRLNLFRSQGPGPVELAWQPTHQESFHVPSRFGYLHLLPA